MSKFFKSRNESTEPVGRPPGRKATETSFSNNNNNSLRSSTSSTSTSTSKRNSTSSSASSIETPISSGLPLSPTSPSTLAEIQEDMELESESFLLNCLSEESKSKTFCFRPLQVKSLYRLPFRMFKSMPPRYNCESLETLIFNQAKLSEIPESIASLPNLSTLDLSSNDLFSIPYFLSQALPNLTHLDLSKNTIMNVPPSLFKVEKLQILILSKNPISSIPDPIGASKNMRLLRCDSCQLKSLPESLGFLELLEYLDVSQNPELGSLPESIGNLPALVTLKCSRSGLHALPKSIGKLKATLGHLHADHNKLVALPDSFVELVNLRTLRVDHNSIAGLNPLIGNLRELQVFTVNNNNIKKLPLSIRELKLNEIHFQENKDMSFPPQGISMVEKDDDSGDHKQQQQQQEDEIDSENYRQQQLSREEKGPKPNPDSNLSVKEFLDWMKSEEASELYLQ